VGLKPKKRKGWNRKYPNNKLKNYSGLNGIHTLERGKRKSEGQQPVKVGKSTASWSGEKKVPTRPKQQNCTLDIIEVLAIKKKGRKDAR